MPRNAFVPGQIAEVEGRSFRSLYPRQTRGLVVAVASVALTAWLAPFHGGPRFFTLFLAALPGLSYGFLRPGGRPVEWWFRALFGYWLSPRVALHARKEGTLRA